MTRGPAIVLAGLLLAACKGAADKPGGSEGLYHLACDYIRTAKGGQMLCVRLNTSTGDAKVVKLESVKLSGGVPAGEPTAPGTFQVECRTVHGTSEDVFTCLRMDRRTGDLVVLSLKDIGNVF